MKLSPRDVIKLAQLAKLDLSPAEIKIYQKQLVKVLDYVNKINKLKLDKIKESLTGTEDNLVGPRPDISQSSQPAVIKQAVLQDGLVVSPEVFER
ncbi:MAG: hypothetical protein C3F02_03425 [Parcubacteria group bacterium]|nr:MAG: hypothetical protein C3F02_03425 [Parcubacteria group bacterium]